MKRTLSLALAGLSACAIDLADPFFKEGTSRMSYSTATVPCATDDGCPTLGCRCQNKTEVLVSACLIYACMDDVQPFCRDYCLNRGGEAMNWEFNHQPCDRATDRLECLICRTTLAEVHQSASCAESTQALGECLRDLDTKRGLFTGVRSVDWYSDATRAAKGGLCEAQAAAYLACMQPYNQEIAACDDSKAPVSAPQPPFVPEPEIPADLVPSN
jgi:hypothetical protein